MGVEDVLKGARNGYAYFFAYLGMVAQEMGMEKAIDLFTKMCKTMGAVQGKMVKEQADVGECDAKVAKSLVEAVITDGLRHSLGCNRGKPYEDHIQVWSMPRLRGTSDGWNGREALRRHVPSSPRGVHERTC